MTNRRIGHAVAWAAVLLLSACASQQEQALYHWNGYNNMLYAHLRGDKPLGEQITAAERYFQGAQSKKQRVAPGAHAHLGMLMTKAGQADRARAQFEEEKRLFPESSVFMDFLLKHEQGGKTP